MNKKVLIIKGSPRAEGNTATMADIFAKGAIENHNTVTELFQLKTVYFMLRRK